MQIVVRLDDFQKFLIIAVIMATFTQTFASEAFDNCILKKVKESHKQQLVEDIVKACQLEDVKEPISETIKERGMISKRVIGEREAKGNRYVLTAHKQNYILPITYTSDLNKEAYSFAGEFVNDFKDIEAKLQLSIKSQLNSDDIFSKGDGLYFGFTLQSWWQVYADEVSAPFRETNYQPELFYLTALDYQPFKGNTGLMIGVEHQSNGRSEVLSRSWNRIYVNFLFEKENFALSFKPWWRLPEDEKVNDMGSAGDDNPDIDDYLGQFELGLVYRDDDIEYTFKGRNNLRSDNRGSFELGVSFPIWGDLKGYLQYFNGFGESLIDYNNSQQRLGLGILLTDAL
jgi:phospholipase A1